MDKRWAHLPPNGVVSGEMGNLWAGYHPGWLMDLWAGCHTGWLMDTVTKRRHKPQNHCHHGQLKEWVNWFYPVTPASTGSIQEHSQTQRRDPRVCKVWEPIPTLKSKQFNVADSRVRRLSWIYWLSCNYPDWLSTLVVFSIFQLIIPLLVLEIISLCLGVLHLK